MKQRRHRSVFMLLALLLTGLAAFASFTGCATAPQTVAKRAALADESQATLALMRDRDPGLDRLLSRSAGYAVFPNVGKGGLIVGGAFGRGAVYDSGGALLGYAKVTQGSVGGVIGARSYALLLVFERPAQLEAFKAGTELQFGAEATAIALTEGCSATTRFHHGLAVFALPRGGLMADASLNGQEFAFEPRTDLPAIPKSAAAGASGAPDSTTVKAPTD